MTRYTVDVTNVTILPYIPGVSIPVKPAIIGAQGTYTVGTHLKDVFYCLEVSGGESMVKLVPGASYYAIVSDQDGQEFEVHWMKCISDGPVYRFGLVTGLIDQEYSETAIGVEEGPYVVLDNLNAIKVIQKFSSDENKDLLLMEDVSGQWISSRFGTPGMIGIRIENPGHKLLHAGMTGIQISAQRRDQDAQLNFSHLVCVSAGNPATFLKKVI